MKLFNKFLLLIKNKFQLMTIEEAQSIAEFCQDNNLEGIKSFFENSKIRLFSLPCDSLLNTVFQKGHLEIAQYLLTSRYTKEFHKEQLNEALAHGCLAGGKEIVKYVLSSQELIKRVDLSDITKSVWETSCAVMNTPVIDFLLKNKELLSYVDIHHNDDELFKQLIHHQEYETMQYLIFDVKIRKTKEMERFLNNTEMFHHYADHFKSIKQMFNTRDLSLNLRKELKPKSVNVKKIKI